MRNAWRRVVAALMLALLPAQGPAFAFVDTNARHPEKPRRRLRGTRGSRLSIKGT